MFVPTVLLVIDAMKSIINHFNVNMDIIHLQDLWHVLFVLLDIIVQMEKHQQFVLKVNGLPKVQHFALNVQLVTNVIMQLETHRQRPKLLVNHMK